MMKQHAFFSFRLLGIPLIALTLASCVSVNLGQGSVKKSQSIAYSPPGQGFEDFAAPVVDRAWRHKQDGNSISIMSQCEEKGGFTIEEIKEAVVAEIDNAKIVESKDFEFNERKAAAYVITGEVDGIPSELKLVTFRKHECIYSITYVARSATFAKHLETFDGFLTKFVVP